MNISAKTEYACLAAIELARHYGSGNPVRVRAIAERQGIPPRFLIQILLQLKAAGLVTSTRGAQGGYMLAKSPEKITLGSVVRLVEGEKEPAAANSNSNSPAVRELVRIWDQIATARYRLLDQITLAELLDRIGQRNDLMYYI